MNIPISVVTGVLVRNSKNEFLLVKKAGAVGPYAGMYLPPGGGIEPGERADEAALRELYEETGVTVTNLRRIGFNDDVTENWAGELRHFIGLFILPIMYQATLDQPKTMMTILSTLAGSACLP